MKDNDKIKINEEKINNAKKLDNKNLSSESTEDSKKDLNQNK